MGSTLRTTIPYTSKQATLESVTPAFNKDCDYLRSPTSLSLSSNEKRGDANFMPSPHLTFFERPRSTQ